VELNETLDFLERTPATLRALLQGLPEEWLDANEGRETFSPRDVLGHLILGERTDWVPRLRIVLEHGESRAFEPFDRFGFRGIVTNRPVGALLDELQRAREDSLRYVRGAGLTPADMERRGRHPELGTVTLGQLLATWVVHDLGNLRQIVRVLAKHHANAVGPWRAYLSILGE
jgi:hypothetical protein